MCGISDYYPVVCCLNSGHNKSQSHSHKYVTYRSMKKFDKDSFLLDLANAPFDIYDYLFQYSNVLNVIK